MNYTISKKNTHTNLKLNVRIAAQEVQLVQSQLTKSIIIII